MGEKHSAVGYLFREGAFLPAQETKPVRNEFGLDLFQHRGSVYEGKTGLQFCSLQQAEDLAGFVEKHGGIEKVQKLIADSLERTGLSPRYTRPDLSAQGKRRKPGLCQRPDGQQALLLPLLQRKWH